MVILAPTTRPDVPPVIARLRAGLRDHVEITAEHEADDTPLVDDLDAEVAIAVGGDGTLITQARRLVGIDIPIVGVNVGRLGFLVNFDAESLIQHADVVFGPSPPIRRHNLLSFRVRRPDGAVVTEDVAVNECAVCAGLPYRMIELRLTIDDAEGPMLSGDGVIVATATGSTAHNVSAGGPIVHPLLEAMVITPLAAHSLAFRPIVLRDDAHLVIEAVRTNEGTALVRDGHSCVPLGAGDRVEIMGHERHVSLVDTPQPSYWRVLQNKLRWAAPPNYADTDPPDTMHDR